MFSNFFNMWGNSDKPSDTASSETPVSSVFSNTPPRREVTRSTTEDGMEKTEVRRIHSTPEGDFVDPNKVVITQQPNSHYRRMNVERDQPSCTPDPRSEPSTIGSWLQRVAAAAAESSGDTNSNHTSAATSEGSATQDLGKDTIGRRGYEAIKQMQNK